MTKRKCFLQTRSFCLLKTLTDGLEWCGLLVDYCYVFISCLDSHSDGTHSPHRIHCWDSDEMLHFSKSDEETNSSTSWMVWGWQLSGTIQSMSLKSTLQREHRWLEVLAVWRCASVYSSRYYCALLERCLMSGATLCPLTWLCAYASLHRGLSWLIAQCFPVFSRRLGAAPFCLSFCIWEILWLYFNQIFFLSESCQAFMWLWACSCVSVR